MHNPPQQRWSFTTSWKKNTAKNSHNSCELFSHLSVRSTNHFLLILPPNVLFTYFMTAIWETKLQLTPPCMFTERLWWNMWLRWHLFHTGFVIQSCSRSLRQLEGRWRRHLWRPHPQWGPSQCSDYLLEAQRWSSAWQPGPSSASRSSCPSSLRACPAAGTPPGIVIVLSLYIRRSSPSQSHLQAEPHLLRLSAAAPAASECKAALCAALSI